MKKLTVPESGSQGSTTASRNRFGQYNRQRAMPTQPRTGAQVAIRGFLTQVSQAWRGLTDAVRQAWDGYAAEHPRVDSLGQAVVLTGHQVFVAVNVLNLQLGIDVQLVVPDSVGIAAPVLGVGDGTAAAFELRTVNEVPAGTVAVAFASPPMSPGRKFNGDLRVVAILPGPLADADPVVTAADLIAKYGALAVGQKFFFAVKLVKGGNVSPQSDAAVVLA